MINKRQLISSASSKRLTIQFISDTPIPDGCTKEIYNADGLMTNQLYSTAAYVHGSDFNVQLSYGPSANDFIANKDDQSRVVFCLTTSNVNYTDKWDSYSYGVEVEKITTGYDGMTSIIETMGWNDTNSIAVEYNSAIDPSQLCIWSTNYNNRKVIFVQEDARAAFHDGDIVGPDGVNLTPIENNEVVPLASIKIANNGSSYNSASFRYDIIIDDINGKTADEWFDEFNHLYPDATMFYDVSQQSIVTDWDDTNETTLRVYNHKPYSSWNDAAAALKDKGYLYVIPITKEAIGDGTIVGHIRIIENALRTVQIKADWDQGINGPNIPIQSYQFYDSTTFDHIHGRIAGSYQIIENDLGDKFDLIYDTSGIISEDNTEFKYTNFVEYFIPRSVSGNHIMHLSGEIGDNVTVNVYTTSASIRVSGSFTRSLENFSFTRDETISSDTDNYRINLSYDNTIGWYITSINPCRGTKVVNTNNSNSSIQYEWSGSDWKHYPQSDSAIIVNNLTIDNLEYFGEKLSTSSRIIYNKPSTIMISTDPNFFVNHESDTQWDQLPIELRNIINKSWSFDMKEAEWN